MTALANNRGRENDPYIPIVDVTFSGGGQIRGILASKLTHGLGFEATISSVYVKDVDVIPNVWKPYHEELVHLNWRLSSGDEKITAEESGLYFSQGGDAMIVVSIRRSYWKEHGPEGCFPPPHLL